MSTLTTKEQTSPDDDFIMMILQITPLGLLELDEEYDNALNDANVPEADQQRITGFYRYQVHQEFIRRGRCRICGLKHLAAHCPRLSQESTL